MEKGNTLLSPLQYATKLYQFVEQLEEFTAMVGTCPIFRFSL